MVYQEMYDGRSFAAVEFWTGEFSTAVLPLSPQFVRSTAPACFTLANMLCGYLSVTATLSGSFTAAAWWIVGGGVLDAFDGPLARRLRAESKFGGELDSFSDVITFGVAPSLLFYRTFLMHWGVVGLLLGFLPMMAAALRLARYNVAVRTGSRDYFCGFTSTANGCLLASFVIFSNALPWHSAYVPMATGLVVVSSILMVSGVPYMTLAKFAGGGVWKTPQGALWAPVGVSVLLFPEKAFFPAMLTLMLQGPLGPRIDQVFHHLHGSRQ